MSEFLKNHPGQALLGTVGASVAIGGIGLYAYGKARSIKEYNRLYKLTVQKQDERNSRFQALRAEYELTPERLAIVTTPPNELIQKLQSRSLSAVKVLEAYTAMALEVTQGSNCVTEFVPQALEWAHKLDSLPQLKGPLHGLPFCIKDDMDVKGLDTTHGLAKFLFQPAENSAVLVKVLRDAGGVPFCKTNAPQTLCGFGSHNPIFGLTLNPLNRKLGPGGSSSGTGALVGGGGSVFGLGSDFGGSGRIPAHFNGISSIKPTGVRLSKKGCAERFLPGVVGLTGAPALLAQTAKELALVFRAVVEGGAQRSYDPTVVPIHWNSETFSSRRPLRIGYYTSISLFPALGDTQTVVLKAKVSLESAGHTLIPFQLPKEEQKWMKLIFDVRNGDLGHNLVQVLASEQISPSIQGIHSVITNPYWIRRGLAGLYELLPESKGRRRRIAGLRAGFDASSTRGLWECLAARKGVIDETLSAMADLDLDLILCPAFPFPALHAEAHAKLLPAICYTGFWNLVDFPAGVTPFGTESGVHLEAYNDQGDPLFQLAKSSMRDSVGMPIGVQVVGKPFDEELVLRVLVELEGLYNRK